MHQHVSLLLIYSLVGDIMGYPHIPQGADNSLYYVKAVLTEYIDAGFRSMKS
jgi:hypothetical protein